MSETIFKRMKSFRGIIQAYSEKSYRIIKHEGWRSFFYKVNREILMKFNLAQFSFENYIISPPKTTKLPSTRKFSEKIISEYRQKKKISDNILKISFVVSSPEVGSGGHNKILTAAKYLSQSGHSVNLCFLIDGKFRRQKQLKNFIYSYYFNPKSEIILGIDNIHSCDILCATSWKTAYLVNENRDKAARLFYFVEDIESLFFPLGTDYLKADNTYRMGMHHISYGPWCAKILKERHQAKVDSIPFSIDKKLYYFRKLHNKGQKKVIFFARPEMLRRCFWLGLEALHIFHKRNPNVKIILFGSEQIKNYHVPFPHENVGVLTKEELAKLYAIADVGIAFSTTNPSLVPFEMMACRCPVVDIDYNDNYINYGSKENAKLVGISPEAIAKGIEEMINNDAMRHRLSMNGYQFVSNFPDDKESFMGMEKIFLNAFGIDKSPVKRESEITALFQ